MNADLLPDEPSDLETVPDVPDEASDLDFADMPCTDDGQGGGEDDDRRWEAFIPEEEEWDPQPDPGDFWMENGGPARESWSQTGKEQEVVVCRTRSPLAPGLDV